MEMEKETIEVYINKLKKGIKNLNNLLSLSFISLQNAVSDCNRNRSYCNRNKSLA